MMMKRFAGCFFMLAILFSNATPAQATTFEDLLLSIKSETAILIDGDTGQVLFEKEIHKKMSPASITKVMTGFLALENAELDDLITISRDAIYSIERNSSHIALDTDEELTLENALYALAITSANDAANGIAEHVGGTMEGFASLMNARAKEAGAIHTNFTNAHGLPDPDHYTTVYDMAMITRAAIQTPHFAEIFSTRVYEMPPTNKQQEPRTFWRKSALIVGRNQYDGSIAEKTGYTTDAQHTFAAAAQRDGRTLIAVVMKSSGSKDKLEDTTALFDYGFSEFDSITFSAEEISKGVYALIEADGMQAEADIKGFTCLIPKALLKKDVEIDYVVEGGTAHEWSVKAVFSLPVSDETMAVTELGALKMTALLHPVVDDIVPVVASEPVSVAQDEIEQAEKAHFPILELALGVLGVLAVLYVYLCMRRYLILERRRRRRVRYR